MDEGVVPPCLELGRAEHDTLRWLTRKSNKYGIVPLDRPTLVERINRMCLHCDRGDAALTHLEDAGYVHKVPDQGFQVLIPCYGHESGENYPAPVPPPAGSSTIARSALEGELRTLVVPAVAGTAEKNLNSNRALRRANVCSHVPNLVQLFFSVTVLQNRLMLKGQMNDQAVGANLKRWIEVYDIPPDTIREMILEFIRHPEWCHRSRRMAWEVFLSRREELLTIVSKRPTRNKDWGNWGPTSSRNKDWGNWGPRHTPRASLTT